MPYKSEKLKLPPELDRRRKLSEEDKNEIRDIYAGGILSQRKLAVKYNVSRSLIAIIVNPEREEQVKERIKKHWKDYYKTGKERNEAVQKTRKYKQELYVQGKI